MFMLENAWRSELGKVAEMSIFTYGYYPHPARYRYGNGLKPEVRVGFGKKC